MIKPKSALEISNRISNYLMKNVGVSTIDSGSILKALIDLLSVELETNYRMAAELTTNTFLSSASGLYLDAIGSLFGVKRQPSRTASTVSGIQFFTADQTALSKYIDTSFFNGQEVWSDSYDVRLKVINKVSNYQLSFNRVTVDAEVLRAEVEFLPADRANTYSNPKMGVNVTNSMEIRLKTQTESDASFRSRISKNNLFGVGTANHIYQVCHAIPGVSDIVIKTEGVEPGRILLYVIPTDLTSISAMVEAVKTEVAHVTPLGIIITVKPIELVYIQPVVYLTLKEEVSRAFLEAQMIHNLKVYVDNLQPQSTVSKDLIKQIVESTGLADNISISDIHLYKQDQYGFFHSIPFYSTYTLSAIERFCINPYTPATFTVVG